MGSALQAGSPALVRADRQGPAGMIPYAVRLLLSAARRVRFRQAGPGAPGPA